MRQDQSKGDAQKEPLNATKEDKGSEASKNVLNLEKPAVTGLPTSDAKQGTAQIKASRVKRDTDNVQKDKLDQKPPLGPKIAVQKAPSSIVQDNARGKSPNQGPSVDGKALEKLAKKKESSNNEVSRSPSRKRERESGQGEGKKEETPEKKRRSSPKDVDSPQELKPEKKLSKKHSKSSKHKDSNKVAKSVDPELAKQGENLAGLLTCMSFITKFQTFIGYSVRSTQIFNTWLMLLISQVLQLVTGCQISSGSHSYFGAG